MKYANFKEHKIKRNCSKTYKTPSGYRSYLKDDFHDRCCYCNMPRSLITSPYHIDHFILWKKFKGKKDSLWADYQNLMWSCPKCNLSKGDQYQGDFMHDDRIVNELFYNPETIDYNQIFYRNEYGGIDSDDEKGRAMIKRLKLYRPIHNLAWLVERLEVVWEKLCIEIEQEEDENRKKLLKQIRDRLANIYVKQARAFRAAYNDKVFPEQKEEGDCQST